MCQISFHLGKEDREEPWLMRSRFPFDLPFGGATNCRQEQTFKHWLCLATTMFVDR